MLAKYIANMIMLPKQEPFEYTEVKDSYFGNGMAFKEYHELWDRKAFSVASDDITVHGEYAVNPLDTGARKKVAIICHGQTVTRAGAVKYAKLFYDYGYSIVLFDQRYFGETDGDFCTLGWKESEDIKKVIAKTREIFGADCFLGLHGESMGAASALRLLDTERPDFVVADCPFSDLGMLIDDLSYQKAWILGKPAAKKARQMGIDRYGFDYREVKPIESVKTSDVPICFMHGAKDKLINCKHSVLMYDVCQNPLSELHVFDEADHAQSIFKHPLKYRNTMLEFVSKVEEQAGV